MKGKKGDVLDTMSLLIVLVIFGIGFFILAWIIPQISTGLSQAGLNNSAEGAAAISSLSDFGLNTIQMGFFWLFIGLCIAQLISAFYVDTHPIWLFLYIIVLALTVLLGLYLGNLYQTIITNPAFSGFSQGYISIVMSNIIKIVIGIGALSMIIIFSKWAFYSGGQRV
jgi:hypothetical protein